VKPPFPGGDIPGGNDWLFSDAPKVIPLTEPKVAGCIDAKGLGEEFAEFKELPPGVPRRVLGCANLRSR
jgi:hypothetical protein